MGGKQKQKISPVSPTKTEQGRAVTDLLQQVTEYGVFLLRLLCTKNMSGKISFSSQLAAAATYWLHRSPCHTLASSNCETWLNANKSRQQVTRGDNMIIRVIITNTACSLHLTPARWHGTISLDDKVSFFDPRLKNHFFGDRTRCVAYKMF